MRYSKTKILFLTTLLLFSLVGCAPRAVNVNVENSEKLHSNMIGKNTLIEIGGGLYYDSATRIVYWWNGFLGAVDASTTPCPYYAPNGLPYRYNIETNTFEEISENSQW